MKRLFLAIRIIPDENFLRVYYQLIKQFEGEKIKWVEPHNMHLTLKFFGEIEEVKIPKINAVVKHTVKSYSSFNLVFEGIGVFGSSYNPRLIWFGIRDNESVKLLGNELLNNLETIGFERDRQNFVPHLTAGRIRALSNKKYFQSVIDRFNNVYIQELAVTEISLIESRLTNSGPIYEVIENYTLH